MSRIGKKMAQVVWYVAQHPGCTKLAAGKYAADGVTSYLYNTYAPVDRAIKAGLIKADRNQKTCVYSLTVAS